MRLAYRAVIIPSSFAALAGCASAPASSGAPAATASTAVAAQPATTAVASQAARPAPPARHADVESIDAILGALYDVISGPPGQRRDWDRMRSLFVPGARLIPTGRRPDGTGAIQVRDVEQYIAASGPFLESNGFFEREIARRTERYGNVVHAFSTYESRHTASDPAPFARGINSIQLWFDGKRWFVVTIYWEGESPSNPIPARYLQSSGS